MRPSLLAPLTLLLVALGACAPDRQPPVDMVALVYNPSTRAYEPRRVQLHSVTDVVSMSGSAATFVTGAEIVKNTDDPGLQAATTVEQALKAIIRDEGDEAEVAFIDSDGVLVPSDFHSLNIATTYYNLERTFDFFGRISDLTPEAFGTPKVYYFPSYTEEHVELKDNAAYDQLLQSMLILSFEDLQEIPMAINLGIVGHEMGHNLMNYLVQDRSPIPVTWRWSNDTYNVGAAPGANLLASLEEGYADLWGAGVTCSADLTSCDTNFMAHTTGNGEANARRLDRPHCLTGALRTALETFTADAFSGRASGGLQYDVGSVFASAVWAATEDQAAVQKLGPGEARKQVYQALYRSLSGDGAASNIHDQIVSALPDQTRFQLTSVDGRKGVLDAVIDAASDPVIKAALCSAFLDRFGLQPSDIITCPGTARAYTDCAGSY